MYKRRAEQRDEIEKQTRAQWLQIWSRVVATTATATVIATMK